MNEIEKLKKKIHEEYKEMDLNDYNLQDLIRIRDCIHRIKKAKVKK